MADCLITSGRDKGCKDAVGGISTFYVINRLPNDEPIGDVTDGVLESLNPNISQVFPFYLVGDNSNYGESAVGDRNTGTYANTQTLTFQLNKITKEDHLTLTILSKGYPWIIAKDRMGNYLLFGYQDGVDFTVATSSGAAKTDFNGYTLTGTATEAELAIHLSEEVVEELLLMVVNPTPPPSV